MAIYLERVGEVRIEEGIIASTKRWVERNERGGGAEVTGLGKADEELPGQEVGQMGKWVTSSRVNSLGITQ